MRRRVNAMRWPSRELVEDDSHGVQLATAQARKVLSLRRTLHEKRRQSHEGPCTDERLLGHFPLRPHDRK